ncbi:hypothetical protein [Chroococcidiopsis cubana]|uniref:hypothetical protein n=1 Tax=Chroococcidiopsis cubana TaxID=171392 RepID=UPI000F8C31C6|nr:hypothetical protein [Chroococcidiopsis cubana]
MHRIQKVVTSPLSLLTTLPSSWCCSCWGKASKLSLYDVVDYSMSLFLTLGKYEVRRKEFCYFQMNNIGDTSAELAIGVGYNFAEF